MNFLHILRIDLSILIVNFSHVYIIYDDIFEKMSSGGLEVSFSKYVYIHASPWEHMKRILIRRQLLEIGK